MSIGAAIVGWARGLRAAELVGWAAVAAMSALALTQIVGWGGGRLTAMAQSLTPFVLVAALPLSIAAFVTQRWALGAASAVVAAYVAVLAWPLVSPPSQPAADAAATPVQVFEANLLRTNKRSAAVAATLAHVDADVLVLLEYTFAHASAMRASALADRYPYRIERATRGRGGGTAIWSRYPLEDLGITSAYYGTAMATVQSAQPFVVFAVHPPSPLSDAGQWRAELPGVGDVADNPNLGGAVMIDPATPRMLVGDFNASYWHPAFRELLDDGWHDATQVTHRGFSASWPNDWFVVPPFVRLDHVLVNERLVVLDTHDVDVPGSDHQGLFVTVVAAADG